MKKKIISINEKLCVGCGNCVTSCKQGAIQIIDGKAKLVNENFCDGLGKCIGKCPTDALKIVEKELCTGPDRLACGCPGSMVMDRRRDENKQTNATLQEVPSELRQWPVQLHLVPVSAPYLKNSELVLLSSCSAVASPEVHSKIIKGRSVLMACPKLDNTEGYLEKLSEILKTANTPRLIVATMVVPCCKGLLSLAKEAVRMSARNDIRLEEVVVDLDGNIGDFIEF